MEFSSNDAISNMKKMIEYQLKEKISEQIISEEMALLETQIRQRVKDLLKPFTIDQLNVFRDVLRISDNYNVTIHWPED